MKVGRQSKASEWLTEDGLLQIEAWARDGYSFEQIAKNIGIGESTFYSWKSKHKEIQDAIKKGQAPVLVKLEDAMFRRCEWTTVTEKKVEKVVDPVTNEVTYLRITEQEKVIPPDTTMMIFIAKNRMPEKYKDKPVELSHHIEDKHNALIEAIKGLDND